MDKTMKNFALPLLIGLLVTTTVKTADLKVEDTTPVTTNLTVLEKWMKLEDGMKSVMKTALKTVLPKALEISEHLNVSATCMRDGLYLMTGLRDLKPWAFRFIDASGKMIDGMMSGTITALGDYEECLDTLVLSERSKDKGREMFRGKYCGIDIKLPLPPKREVFKNEVLDELKNFSMRNTVLAEAAKMAHLLEIVSVRFGVCMPSGCSVDDLNQLTSYMSEQLMISAKAEACEIKEPKKYPVRTVAVMAAYSTLGLLMLIGSLIDMYALYNDTTYHHVGIRVLLAFSFISNFKRLVRTPEQKSPLGCCNAIRFTTMAWVILDHTYISYLIGPTIMLKSTQRLEDISEFALQAITNSTLIVDTFFCMGGFILCYIITKRSLAGKKTINLPFYVFHRYWRIVPSYGFVIMGVFVLPLFTSGPTWREVVDPWIHNCERLWWTNLVFVNNFFEFLDLCLPHCWYMGCDFQLYLLALIVLIPLARWPRAGVLVNILAIVASILYTGITTYVAEYPPTTLMTNLDVQALSGYTRHVYYSPFCHGSSYFIGVLAGHFYAKKPNIKIPRIWLVLGWCTAIICNMSVLYGAWEWNKGAEPKVAETVFYAALQRPAWSTGVTWMIFCCATGHGGVVNYILSWDVWIPLARVTFMAYLIHEYVMITYLGSLDTLVTLHHFSIVWIFFGNLLVTFATAFVMSMLIEAPFTALENIVFGKLKASEREDANDNKNINNMSFHEKANQHPAVITMPAPTGFPQKEDKSQLSRL